MSFIAVMPPPAENGGCPPNTKYMPCMGPQGKAFICDPGNGFRTKEEACKSTIFGKCPEQYSCDQRNADGSCPAGEDDDGNCRCPQGHRQLIAYCDQEAQNSIRSSTKSFFSNSVVQHVGLVIFFIVIGLLYVVFRRRARRPL